MRKEGMKIKSEVGYMKKSFQFYEEMKIEENIELVESIYKIDKVKDNVEKKMDEMGIKKRGGKLEGKIQGGWKKRMEIEE